MRSSLGAVVFCRACWQGVVGWCCRPLEAPPFLPFPYRRTQPLPSIPAVPSPNIQKKDDPANITSTATPDFPHKPTTARCCLHTLWMGHHLWQSRLPGQAQAPTERQSEKGVCALEGVGVGVMVRGAGENLEVRRGWCPRIWCHQAPDEKQGREVLQREEPHARGLPSSHHFSLLDLSLGSLPLHPSLPPPTPFCLPFSHLRIFEHPAFRSRDRTPQRSAPWGPQPCAPARPPPLPGPLRSGSHPEEQVEAEQQVLDAPQAPTKAPHAAAPAAGSGVPRPGLGAPGAGGEGAERDGPWAGPAAGGAGGGRGGGRGGSPHRVREDQG